MSETLDLGTGVRVCRGPLAGQTGTVADVITVEGEPDIWYSLRGSDGAFLWYRDGDGDGTGVFRVDDLERI